MRHGRTDWYAVEFAAQPAQESALNKSAGMNEGGTAELSLRPLEGWRLFLFPAMVLFRLFGIIKLIRDRMKHSMIRVNNTRR